MVAFADTGFIVSLYLAETTSVRARVAIKAAPVAFPLTPLVELEIRNAFNRAVHRGRITSAQRDALWRDVESDLVSGFLVRTPTPSEELHKKARALSDIYTASNGARTLDLLHVAAALVLGATEFFSFDERQRKVASDEGLKVKP